MTLLETLSRERPEHTQTESRAVNAAKSHAQRVERCLNVLADIDEAIEAGGPTFDSRTHTRHTIDMNDHGFDSLELTYSKRTGKLVGANLKTLPEVVV